MNYFNLGQGEPVNPGAIHDYQMLRNAAHGGMGASVSENPLSDLARQLSRVTETQQRLGSLVERLAGPQPIAPDQQCPSARYGGVVGALEGEAQTLRRNLDAMHVFLDVIERVVS